jgi:hypothetical protein
MSVGSKQSADLADDVSSRTQTGCLGGTAMTRTELNPLHGTDWDPLLGDEFKKEYWSCLQRCIEQERSGAYHDRFRRHR